MTTLTELPRRLHRLSRNAFIDMRYGGRFLGGSRPSRFRDQDASHTVNTSYSALAHLFQQITILPSDVLVDVGCGKGRVLNWWLSQGFTNKLVGIELDPEIAASLRRRLRRYHNITILSGNASEVLPAEGTIFYLYNPFGASTLTQVKKRIETDCHGDVTVLYYNPRHIGVFAEDTNWDVSEMAKDEKAHRDHGAAICRYKRPESQCADARSFRSV